MMNRRIASAVHGFGDLRRNPEKPGGLHPWGSGDNRIWNSSIPIIKIRKMWYISL